MKGSPWKYGGVVGFSAGPWCQSILILETQGFPQVILTICFLNLDALLPVPIWH